MKRKYDWTLIIKAMRIDTKKIELLVIRIKNTKFTNKFYDALNECFEIIEQYSQN